MAWIEGADATGRKAWIDSDTGTVRYSEPVVDDGGESPPPRISSLDDVYVAFNEIGERDPIFEQGEHARFVGMPYEAMRAAVLAYFNQEPAWGPESKPPVTVIIKDKDVPKQVGDDIASQVLNKALDALKAIQIIRDELSGQVKKKVEEAFPGLAKALEAIQKQLNSNMLTIIPNTISLVGAALGGVETLLATFLSNSADIGDIADVAIEAVSGQKHGLAGWVMDLIVGDQFNLAGEIGGKILGAFDFDGTEVESSVSMVAAIVPSPPPVDI